MIRNLYEGVITALITPMRNGMLDIKALEKIIEIQIKAKVEAILIAGSTGEGNILSDDEYYNLIDYVIKYNMSRVAIIVAVNEISTEEAIKKIRKLYNFDIQGIMLITPYYVYPTQEGIIQHYIKLNEVSKWPILIYINPKRTGIDLEDNTIVKLSELKNIAAIKDASLDIERPLRLSKKLMHINFLSGNDNNVIAYNIYGGKGVVSVISNIIPDYCVLIQRKYNSGEISLALDMQSKVLKLYNSLVTEVNPIGIKYAASLLNLCKNECKLPLTIASKETAKKIQIAVKTFNINKTIF